MTISSQTRTAGPFTGNGVTTVFPFVFKIFLVGDLQVVRTDSVTGLPTTLAITTDYTVSMNADQNASPGGSIMLNVALATGLTLVITSALPLLQATDLTNGGGFYPAVITNAFDRLTIFCQQLFGLVGRAIKFPLSDGIVAPDLPISSLRANNLLGFDASGNPIAVVPNLQSAAALQTLLAASNGVAMVGNAADSRNLAASSGASLMGWIQSGAGAVARTLQNKGRDAISVKDFGSVGDGVADEVASWTAVNTNAKAALVPFGSYKFATAFDSGNTPLVAFGATLNPLVPASSFFRSFIDLGQKAIIRNSLRTAAEYAGTPTVYTYLTALASFNITHNNSAGYQQNYTTDAGGRTSVPAFYISGFHNGYGDMPGYSTHLGVSKHPSSASVTTWSGANSVVLYDGEAGAVTDRVNLYGCEYHLSDNAQSEVTAHGAVYDFNRQSIGVALNNVWTGVRLQTSGTQYADSGLSINGTWKVGIDFTGATLLNSCAMALKTNDRIYFGVAATAPPTWYASTLVNNYMQFDGTKFNIVAGNVAALQISSAAVVSLPIHTLSASFNVPGTGNIASTVGAAGTAAAPPAAPFTYLKIQIDGTTYKLPVYNN